MPVNLPICRTSLRSAELVQRAAAGIQSLYLHVPFCATKCSYCDFYSLPGESQQRMAEYVSAVLNEASWWSGTLTSPIRTVFLGGGTPTLLPRRLMQELLRGLRKQFPIAQDVEWTTEANPATLDSEYCAMLLGEGVNRLSIGVQSFVDSELLAINRIHNAATAKRTIETARAAGFDNLGMDLMYALPGQTPTTWEYSLDTAISLGTRHLSAYCLTLEESTPMWHAVDEGKLRQPDEAQQIEFVRQTRTKLSEAGLPPYEISNFAAPGYECRHNQMYWRAGNYIGLGPAAASHMAPRRWRNLPDLKDYLRCVRAENAVPITDDETLGPSQQAIEMVMLTLRTREGLSLGALKHLTDAESALPLSAIARLSQLGLLYADADVIALTESGVLVADDVIREVIRGLT